MSELYIPPKRIYRNPTNGQFLKGLTPHNKGKKWEDYMDMRKAKRIKRIALSNLKHNKLKALKEKAKTDYKAFREMFPKLPADRTEQVYWRGWRLFESVGKMLCEFNIKNK